MCSFFGVTVSVYAFLTLKKCLNKNEKEIIIFNNEGSTNLKKKSLTNVSIFLIQTQVPYLTVAQLRGLVSGSSITMVTEVTL